MSSKTYTFIIVPDAKSQCRRYTIPKSLFYAFGIAGTILLIVLSVLIHTLWNEYRAIASKVAQVEKFKKISLSQESTIDRYEEDIVQLGKNLTHIKQLNSRLMILTGLDPDNGENNLGLGGSEESDPKQKEEEKSD